jgi:Short C-terminal domain/Phospholipase_D-nuclease N-terminal
MTTLATTRQLFGRPVVPLLALAAVIIAGCNQVGTQTLTFWDLVWGLVIFFFWFMFIWIFITIFADIFRRRDLTGGWKAIWIVVLVLIPFLGALIYIISRPKVTAQDVEMLTQAEAGYKAAAAVSSTDQLAKLAELKASGAITEPEYNTLKAQIIGGGGATGGGATTS